MQHDPLPLAAVPALDSDARARWHRALTRRMQAAGLGSASEVGDCVDFGIRGFTHAFSRLRQAHPDELRRWFVDGGGARARRLAEALDITASDLVNDLRASVEPPPAPWHVAFPGIQPEAVYIDPPVAPDEDSRRQRRRASFVPPGPTSAESATPATFEDAVQAWFRDSALAWSKAPDARVGWLIGEPGSGRRTLSARLAAVLDIQICADPPPQGWPAWRGVVRGRHLACVTPDEIGPVWHDCVEAGDRVWHMAPWRAEHLRALVERLDHLDRNIDPLMLRTGACRRRST